jgi:hypothetical protein
MISPNTKDKKVGHRQIAINIRPWCWYLYAQDGKASLSGTSRLLFLRSKAIWREVGNTLNVSIILILVVRVLQRRVGFSVIVCWLSPIRIKRYVLCYRYSIIHLHGHEHFKTDTIKVLGFEIWPWVDEALAMYERGDIEKVDLWIEFLRLLKKLRVVFLQDAAILMNSTPRPSLAPTMVHTVCMYVGCQTNILPDFFCMECAPCLRRITTFNQHQIGMGVRNRRSGFNIWPTVNWPFEWRLGGVCLDPPFLWTFAMCSRRLRIIVWPSWQCIRNGVLLSFPLICSITKL